MFEGLLQYLCLLGGEADVLAQLFDYVAFGGDVAKDGADEAAGKTAAWSEQSAGQTADGATSSCSTALTEQQREGTTDCRTANGATKPAGESSATATPTATCWGQSRTLHTKAGICSSYSFALQRNLFLNKSILTISGCICLSQGSHV